MRFHMSRWIRANGCACLHVSAYEHACHFLHCLLLQYVGIQYFNTVTFYFFCPAVFTGWMQIKTVTEKACFSLPKIIQSFEFKVLGPTMTNKPKCPASVVPCIFFFTLLLLYLASFCLPCTFFSTLHLLVCPASSWPCVLHLALHFKGLISDI